VPSELRAGTIVRNLQLPSGRLPRGDRVQVTTSLQLTCRHELREEPFAEADEVTPCTSVATCRASMAAAARPADEWSLAGGRVLITQQQARFDAFVDEYNQQRRIRRST
jgi:hypothetical protein